MCAKAQGLQNRVDSGGKQGVQCGWATDEKGTARLKRTEKQAGENHAMLINSFDW